MVMIEKDHTRHLVLMIHFKAANNGEVFDEAIKSDDYVAILCNCMKILEEKVNELLQITSSAKENCN